MKDGCLKTIIDINIIAWHDIPPTIANNNFPRILDCQTQVRRANLVVKSSFEETRVRWARNDFEELTKNIS